jgi:predicted metal-dependent hydrolase
VRIAAPERMSLDAIRVFAISRLSWIRQQQDKFKRQERETPREYLDRESHYIWGKRYLMRVVETQQPSLIELNHNRMILRLRPGTSRRKRRDIVNEWYRAQIKQAVPSLIAKWERPIGVKVKRFFVQHMKTKWGSCNYHACTIRLNTDLAQKPQECLEYIVVHEMVHILEPTHNNRFIALMNQFMPKWEYYSDNLNRLPVRHEKWTY